MASTAVAYSKLDNSLSTLARTARKEIGPAMEEQLKQSQEHLNKVNRLLVVTDKWTKSIRDNAVGVTTLKTETSLLNSEFTKKGQLQGTLNALSNASYIAMLRDNKVLAEQIRLRQVELGLSKAGSGGTTKPKETR